MKTSCSSWEKQWRAFGCEFWVAPGGLLGTADACPELPPYQDPSARHSATRLTLYPSFCLYLSVSVCRSVCLCLTASVLFASFSEILSETESRHCWLQGDIFISDSWRVVFWKTLHCWPLPSAVILAVAEGYDTFNIVFMAIGDSRATECFSMSSTQWLTTSMQHKHWHYNSAFISSSTLSGLYKQNQGSW